MGRLTNHPFGAELYRTVQFGDSSSVDSFGRVRTSQPFTLYDNKNIHTSNPQYFNEVKNGVGAAITFLPNEAAVKLEVGTASGEYAIRQSRRRLAYVPGKSQLIIMTGVLGAPKTNVVQRLGYYDQYNGLFFQIDSSGLSVVQRSSTSGSPVDTSIPQNLWNIDRMNGGGPSRATLDPSKSNIFVIDFQWLGVGRVRFGVDIGGVICYVHEFQNANSIDKVYMSTPSLPVRYEIRNVGVTASATSMKEICASVTAEGGYTLPGDSYHVSNKFTTRSISARTPILAIRLKTALNGKPNHKTVHLHSHNMYSEDADCYFELVHVNDPSAITATWTSVDTDSGVEFSTDISAVTGNESHTIEGTYVSASQAATSSGIQTVANGATDRHRYLSQNYDSTNSQMFIIYATAKSGTTDVSAGITFIESE